MNRPYQMNRTELHWYLGTVRGHRQQTVSKLVLVDLAGSERVAKSEATGLQLVEAQHINR